MLRTLLLVAAVTLPAGCADLTADKSGKPPLILSRDGPTPGIAPPVRVPPVKAAADANLPDDAQVAGVVVNGKPRAYTLKALSPMDRHVVNDLIGDVPVSVTYCDIHKCLRVFTADRRGRPLLLMQMGRYTDGLLLGYEEKMYAQSTGKNPGGDIPDLPLAKLDHELTTWKAWRAKHPTTEVYTGPDDAPTKFDPAGKK